jgi:Methyltransferase domain
MEISRQGRATPADRWLGAVDDLAAQVLSIGGALLGGLGADADRPTSGVARERYRACAETYDVRTAWGAPYRREGVLRLSPAPGEVIVDVGCGTGLNFGAIQAGIGPGGALVGVDLCPEMLARAGDRARRHGWANVTLIAAPAEGVDLPVARPTRRSCAPRTTCCSRPRRSRTSSTSSSRAREWWRWAPSGCRHGAPTRWRSTSARGTCTARSSRPSLASTGRGATSGPCSRTSACASCPGGRATSPRAGRAAGKRAPAGAERLVGDQRDRASSRVTSAAAAILHHDGR